MFNIIKLNALDNVAIAPMNIPVGVKINSNLIAQTNIPFGHKISLSEIKKGNLIYKYGQIIGIATDFIKKGTHVHSHNLAFHEFNRSFKNKKINKQSIKKNNIFFNGYKRKNGSVGTRNYIGLISTVNCSATVVKKIADKLNKYLDDKDFNNIDGAVCLKHSSGCGMNTSGKGDFLYGRIDVKAKLPFAAGTWPAIWMLPTDWIYGGWPASGEIDIMEHVGCNLNWVKGSVHTEDCNWNNGCPNQSAGGNGQDQFIPGVSDNYNIYSIEWSASKLDFLINDDHYWTFLNIGSGSGMWPFDKKFHIILNLAIGGSWGGICPIDNSSFPQQMVVDFVRVYEKIN